MVIVANSAIQYRICFLIPISSSSNSKTYSDLREYDFKSNKINYSSTFNLNIDNSNGSLEVYNEEFKETIPIINNNVIFNTSIKNNYSFKFIVENYFIQELNLDISESKMYDINLKKIEKNNNEILSNLIFKQSSVELTESSKPYLIKVLKASEPYPPPL